MTSILGRPDIEPSRLPPSLWARLRERVLGPPWVVPEIDVARLVETGGMFRYRTRATVAETSRARSFAIGFVFGGICVFGLIAWLTAGLAGRGP